MGALGVATRPHEHRLQVGRRLHLACCLVVERRIVDGAQHLASGLILELQEVREIIFAEGGIVPLQGSNAFLSVRLAFGRHERGVGKRCYLLAVFAPRLDGLFLL